MHQNMVITCLLILAFISTTAFAHSEHDKARFVSFEGTDTGKCDKVLRPCKTISYAAQQANKGDKVLVSAGQYDINSSDDLFFLQSDLIPVTGGYNRFDHFQSQSPQSNVTVLNGVPVELRSSLQKSGFTVIADGKSLAENKSLQEKFSAYNQLSQKQIDQTCINNKAGSFDCNNIDLLAHVPLSSFSSKPSAANDIWGHVDLNTGDEYAIIGLKNGVAIVNVTEPTNPIEVGTVVGKSSSWRDIKVYQYFDNTLNLWRAYAYATIDNAADYVTIIDLNHLPNSVSLVDKNKVVTQAHNVYISNVDHSLNIALADISPSLQLTGSNKYNGAFHSYSLTDPEKIIELTSNSSGSGYTHDGASILIKDNRKETDCQVTSDTCSVFIDFNEKDIKLWNITDASESLLLGTAQYNDVTPANQYVHSGWASEDNQFIFIHDEFDEINGGLNTTVRIFSIADLTNPQQVGQWTGSTRAIDHNGFVRGNRYYMSNYQKGLTVLDITDPANPVEIGNFDTFTPSNNANYAGAWGAYPFLPSGNILVSDINSGLYILKDNTLSSTQGELSFTSKIITTEQDQDLQIKVHRQANAGSASTVNVDYIIIPGSAKQHTDYTPVTGTLTWLDNNSDDQVITVPIAADLTSEELQESFFVRLYNPTHGATLSSPSYLTVQINGIVDNGVISFIQSEILVAENQATLSIEVSRDGSSQGETSVNYQLINSSTDNNAEIGLDIEQASGTLTWADGNSDNQTITLNLINDNINEVNEQLLLQLESVNNSRLGANQQIVITISDDDNNTAPQVTLSENIEVNTGQNVNLTVTATDAENDPLSYFWSQSSGTSVLLSSTDQSSTSFVAPANSGTLEFSATVTDSKGAQTTNTITITVVAIEVITVTPNNSGGSIRFNLLAFLLLICLRKRQQIQ